MLMATAMTVLTAHGQTTQSTAVRVNSEAPTYLYGGQASKLEGDIKKRGGDNFAWKGNGTVSWEVQVAKGGEYAVGLCHAAEPGGAGQEFQVAGGGGRLNYTLRSTKGVLGNMSYETAPVMGSLRWRRENKPSPSASRMPPRASRSSRFGVWN